MDKWKIFRAALVVAVLMLIPSLRAASVNSATLSSDVKWSSVAWDGGATFDPSLPVEFTLTKSVSLTFDVADVSIVSMKAKGAYRLTLVSTKVPELPVLATADGAVIVLKGSTKSTAPVTWLTPIALDGDLVTQSYLNLAASGEGISGKGSVTVETGVLNLQASRWELTEDLTLNLTGGTTLSGTGDGFAALDFYGITAINVLANGTSTAKITAPIRFRGDAPSKAPAVNIAAKTTLLIESTVAEDGKYSKLTGWTLKFGGEGTLSVSSSATIPSAADCFCSGGVTGAGTLLFMADPKDGGVTASLKASGWTGTCDFRGAHLSDFSPANFGHVNSKVGFLGTTCTFASNPLYAPTLVMDATDDSYAYSLAVKAASGTKVDFTVQDGMLSGTGKLKVCDGGFRVFVPRTYTGSMTVDAGSSGIVIGAYTDEYESCFGEGAGMIRLWRGTSTVALGATWEAANGISMRSEAVLQDDGEILSPVNGSGKVIYTGTVAAGKPEYAACFDDANSWSGRVTLANALVSNCDISRAGNANAELILEAASGSLAAKKVNTTVTLRGEGFTVTEAADSQTATIAKLAGSGALTIASGSAGAGSSYRMLDISDYSGAITVTASTGCSLVLGDTEREADGVLQVADGMRFKSKRNWTVTHAIFGKSLYIDGACGDAVMRVTGSYVDFSGVQVHIVNDPVDSRRRYKLEYVASSRQIKIAETTTPPTVGVEDIQVIYGVDFTNAVVRMSVTNYWEGYQFAGQAIAKFRVYSDSGALVGAGDAVISGDGTFDLGKVFLHDGRGEDFRYEIDVVAVDDAGSEVETMESFSLGKPAVHDEGAWFRENAATFSLGGKDGKWEYEDGDAYVTNENSIAVRIFDDEKKVRFAPTRDVTGDVVRVCSEVIFETAVTPSAIADPTNGACRLAGITIANSGDARVDTLQYLVWVPSDESEIGGSFEPVFGSSYPTLGTTHVVEWTINYQTGFVTYTIDDSVLTNADGISSFAIPPSIDRKRKKVCYSGAGFINTLVGDLYNGNLAGVVSGETTNEYSTVEEAVAVVKEGEKVALLWDASWKPLAEDVGRIIEFDTGDHKLVLDAATTNRLAQEGYGITDLGNGKFRVDTIEFHISFKPNGALDGTMDDIYYSITNMVFALPPNGFEKEGYDFKAWNQYADGSGATNWEDEATIDMNEFGLTNMILYAQWVTATRCIVVEAADEFVYIETVLTNGVANTGVRYFQEDAAKATGTAAIPVLNGSDLIIRFSTDLEKRLTFEYVKATEAIVKNSVIEHKDLPQIYVEGVNEILDPIHEWAASRGISFSALSKSLFSQSSYDLGLDTLITQDSEVSISDFSVGDDCCSFKVAVDGQTVANLSSILPMIRVANDLNEAVWSTPENEDVSVSADGTITVQCARFVKIVIPQNN